MREHQESVTGALILSIKVVAQNADEPMAEVELSRILVVPLFGALTAIVRNGDGDGDGEAIK